MKPEGLSPAARPVFVRSEAGLISDTSHRPRQKIRAAIALREVPHVG
jgi:hypothetical protein